MFITLRIWANYIMGLDLEFKNKTIIKLKLLKFCNQLHSDIKIFSQFKSIIDVPNSSIMLFFNKK